jgi:hypothetical protein
MPLKPNSRIIRAQGMQTSRVDEDIVILNLQTNNYVALDAIGRRIWELIESPVLVSEISRRLEGEFSAPSNKIEADVLKFLDELQSEGLVHVVED